MSEGGRILLVDDEIDILEIVKEILEDEGHEVIVAKDGEEGLARLREGPVDLIILDIMMPKMSGPEMVEALREREDGAEPPILMISAGTTGKEIAHSLGCHFLVKPFDLDEIVDRSEALLDHHEDSA